MFRLGFSKSTIGEIVINIKIIRIFQQKKRKILGLFNLIIINLAKIDKKSKSA